MAKRVMRREASDNVYLHKDFHGALSTGIQYLEENFGEEAVREYLRDFTNAYFAPLKADIKQRGLSALKEYFEELYEKEGGEAEITLGDDELVICVAACPAVTHMRQHGYQVANMFYETTKPSTKRLSRTPISRRNWSSMMTRPAAAYNVSTEGNYDILHRLHSGV